MHNQNADQDDRPALRYPKRAAAVFLLTILLGPPLGSLVVFGPMYLSSKGPGLSLAEVTSAFGVTLLLGYVFGLVRACLAGLWIAYRVWRTGNVGYLECIGAALAAVLVGSVYLLAVGGFDYWSGMLALSASLGVAAIIAAPACRWIAARMGILPS